MLYPGIAVLDYVLPHAEAVNVNLEKPSRL